MSSAVWRVRRAGGRESQGRRGALVAVAALYGRHGRSFPASKECLRGVGAVTVLVTGGAGFIGSHTAVELLGAGYRVVLLDDLRRSRIGAVEAVRSLTGRDVPFVRLDVCDRRALDSLFAEWRFDAVVHFAALKAIDESVVDPLHYYRANFVGTLTLLEAMRAHGVRTLVHSSSAAVYGEVDSVPVAVGAATRPTSPYGRTKLLCETLLRDLHAAEPDWRISILRYFNPAGAHRSGALGEDPLGEPANLMPRLGAVAMGHQPYLEVYGTDYPTPDGTAVRDYVHVADAARAHAKALEMLSKEPGLWLHDLGLGLGHSVLEVVRAYEAACGRAIPLRCRERRAGDVARCYADPSLAREQLGWEPAHDLARMCQDAWRWQSAHPEGFEH